VDRARAHAHRLAARPDGSGRGTGFLAAEASRALITSRA
jgi:hypothetical protein